MSRGYNQIEDMSYFAACSFVAKLTTVKLVLGLDFINHWFVHQLNVNNAFLQVQPQEDVSMIISHGISPSKPNQVNKLIESLYCLK